MVDEVQLVQVLTNLMTNAEQNQNLWENYENSYKSLMDSLASLQTDEKTHQSFGLSEEFFSKVETEEAALALCENAMENLVKKK